MNGKLINRKVNVMFIHHLRQKNQSEIKDEDKVESNLENKQRKDPQDI